VNETGQRRLCQESPPLTPATSCRNKDGLKQKAWQHESATAIENPAPFKSDTASGLGKHTQSLPWLHCFVPSPFSCQAGLLLLGSGCCCWGRWIPGPEHPSAPSTTCRYGDLARAFLPSKIQPSTEQQMGYAWACCDHKHLCGVGNGGWEGGKETDGLSTMWNKGHGEWRAGGAGWDVIQAAAGVPIAWLWLCQLK